MKYNNEVPCFIDIVIWDKSNAKTPAQIIEHRNNFNMIKKQMLKNFHDLKLPPVIDVGYYMLGMYDGMNKIEIDKDKNIYVYFNFSKLNSINENLDEFIKFEEIINENQKCKVV